MFIIHLTSSYEHNILHGGSRARRTLAVAFCTVVQRSSRTLYQGMQNSAQFGARSFEMRHICFAKKHTMFFFLHFSPRYRH